MPQSGPEHPATQGIRKSYIVKDEIYQMKNFFRDRVHGILTLEQKSQHRRAGRLSDLLCKNTAKAVFFYTLPRPYREDVWEKPGLPAASPRRHQRALGLAKAMPCRNPWVYGGEPRGGARGLPAAVQWREPEGGICAAARMQAARRGGKAGARAKPGQMRCW